MSSLLVALLASCSIDVSTHILQPLVQLESGYNPYAIGVVGSSVRQPRSLHDFIQTISDLNNKNKNYSIGLAQINIKNLQRFKIPVLDAVEPCNNIKLSSVILKECYKKYNDIGKMLSCYYSGNGDAGFRRDFNNSYVERFLSSYANMQENVVIDFDYDKFYQLKTQVENYKFNETKLTSNNELIKKNSIVNKFSSNRKKTIFNKSINVNEKKE
jgi:type IV secretion system protein VirB1